MDLSRERWEGSTPTEREAIARQLASHLPAAFAFDSIRLHSLGEQQHHVALYRHDAVPFALLPGGPVTLGYKADRPWKPNPDELESWQRTAEEYSIDKTIHEFVAAVTLRPRQVELPPLLIETAAGELGWESIAVDDPDVQAILREHGSRPQVTMTCDGVSTRVRKGEDGSIIAERSLERTHAELAAGLRAAGFRFPTSDEWEHACGGGAPTLFRWGDHVPCDRYPVRAKPDWDLHCRPNAFGLFIASDPYKYELVAEVGTTRGGDGGSTVCGGAGFFIGWLTLATAYFEEDTCRHDPTEPVQHGFTVGRRVLELR